ncbi:MAG: cyoE [Candidatus Saccharibacteria bacterium]|nr:cyoE [Candidatus Saccharibacteria bacterium]
MASRRDYYQLTKPGIIRGNVMTTIAGFLLASRGHISWSRLVLAIIGMSLVIGGACVSNNYLDRGIDRHMERTRKRAMVRGTISPQRALTFAAGLLIAGAVALAFVNWISLALGLFGVFAYVALYGLAKRRSVHGTLVGSISGAIPIVTGYTAASGRLDGAAGLLFVVLTVWQMPHFYAIAIYRRQDYAAAGLPVLPVVRGIAAAKRQIIAYIAGFVVACTLLTILGYTGYVYLAIMLVVGLYWLKLALKGRRASDDNRWAKQVFGMSLATLTVFSVVISVNWWLP